MLGVLAEWLCMQLPETWALFNCLACSPFLFPSFPRSKAMRFSMPVNP